MRVDYTVYAQMKDVEIKASFQPEFQSTGSKKGGGNTGKSQLHVRRLRTVDRRRTAGGLYASCLRKAGGLYGSGPSADRRRTVRQPSGESLADCTPAQLVDDERWTASGPLADCTPAQNPLEFCQRRADECYLGMVYATTTH